MKLRLILALFAIYMLAGCGGGGTNGGSTVDTPNVVVPLKYEIMPVPTNYTDNGDYIGIGPAFLGESPGYSDVSQNSQFGSNTFLVKYGNWNDSQGRDGSATAAEMVRYLKSFQTQENKEAQRDGQTPGDLQFTASDVKEKIIRLSQSATDQERQQVAKAIREINAALPWEFRIILGSDFSQPFNLEDVPKGEIHLQFTNGKSSSSWPDDSIELTNLLGIGGLNSMRGGFVLIDTDATETVDTSSSFLQFVVTHELLHAIGIGGHPDADLYPYSILASTATANWKNSRPIYASLDGESLLVNISPGTRVADLNTNDLGTWEETGFHLVGVLGLDNDQQIQFGTGFRNGLGKPWAYGPTPTTPIQENPTLTGSLKANWSGYLLGFSRIGKTIAGTSEIAIDFKTLSGEANFDNLEYWGIKAAPGSPGTGTMWQNGDLGYTIAIVREGTIEGFVSTSSSGDDPGVVSGAFVGSEHEGAIGTVEHPDLSAGFGATR